MHINIKKVTVIFTLLLLAFLINPSISHADIFPAEVTNDSARHQNQCKEGYYEEEGNKALMEYKEEKAGIMEGIFVNILHTLTKWANLNSMPTVIFGNPYCGWASESNTDDYKSLIYGVFTQYEMDKIIKPGASVFSGIFVSLLTLSIMTSTIKLAFTSISPQSRIEFAQDVQMWVLSAIFMTLLWPFVNVVFYFNAAIVDQFYIMMREQGIVVNKFTILSELQMESMTDIFIYLAEWVLTIIMNFIYIGRKVILTLLLIISPLSALSLLFSASRKYFGIWIKSFISVVFVNAIHAIVFFSIVMLNQVSGGNTSFIFKLILIALFIPLTSMSIQWLNVFDHAGIVGKQLSTQGMQIGRSLAQAGGRTLSNVNQLIQRRLSAR